MQNWWVSKHPSDLKIRSLLSIGVDLGGTKVAAALVGGDGQIFHEVRRETVPLEFKNSQKKIAHSLAMGPTSAQVQKHIQYVVETMTDAILEVAAATEKPIYGLGLASAGPMNVDEGTLNHPANFRGWKKVPLVSLLTQSLKKKKWKMTNRFIGFQNDAMAAALGEGWLGRAKGCSTYAVITVGTGIGTGVILNGRPAQSRGMGSEWGHLLVNVPGIKSRMTTTYESSVEGFSSGTGLLKRAQARGFRGQSTPDLAEAARAGDPLAKEVFLEASEGLAALFYNLSLGFHPEKFVVSGGMLAIRELYLPQAIELYRSMIKSKNAGFLAPVQIAKLGGRAGVIGAARLPFL